MRATATSARYVAGSGTRSMSDGSGSVAAVKFTSFTWNMLLLDAFKKATSAAPVSKPIVLRAVFSHTLPICVVPNKKGSTAVFTVLEHSRKHAGSLFRADAMLSVVHPVKVLQLHAVVLAVVQLDRGWVHSWSVRFAVETG